MFYHKHKYFHLVCPKSLTRPKKNIVCFRFPTDPIKTCATQIYFMDFIKKLFFFGGGGEIHELMDELLAVVRKGEGGLKKPQKNKKSLHNHVQIKHA